MEGELFLMVRTQKFYFLVLLLLANSHVGCAPYRIPLRRPPTEANREERLEAYRMYRYKRTVTLIGKVNLGTYERNPFYNPNEPGSQKEIYKPGEPVKAVRYHQLGGMVIYHIHDLLPLVSKDSKAAILITKAGHSLNEMIGAQAVGFGLGFGVGMPAAAVGLILTMVAVMSKEHQGMLLGGIVTSSLAVATIVGGVVYASVRGGASAQQVKLLEQKAFKAYNPELKRTLRLTSN